MVMIPIRIIFYIGVEKVHNKNHVCMSKHKQGKFEL